MISATGAPAPVLSVAGLPPGLSFDAASGLISGTPEAAGTSTLTVTANNGCNAAAVQTYTLTIDRAATALSLVALPQVAVFGQPVSVSLVAFGGPASPQGTVQLCVRGTGMFCGPPFDTIPPGTPPEKIATPLSRALDPNGRADFRLTGLTIDAFTLSALYAGDSSHLPASAGPVDELVIKGVLLPVAPGGRASAAGVDFRSELDSRAFIDRPGTAFRRGRGAGDGGIAPADAALARACRASRARDARHVADRRAALARRPADHSPSSCCIR